MKILDYETFWTTVEPLWKFELDEMGITPDSELGYFSKKRFDELVDYCRKHPDCHIISQWKNMSINAAIPNAGSYMLGIGDQTPDLIWLIKRDKNYKKDLELLKF